VNIEGYNKIMKHRANGRGGGVALYIDSQLSFEPLDNLCDIGSDEFESIFANVSVSHNNKITVGTIYRPPGNNIEKFNISFEVLLNRISNRHCKTYLAGDFNINLLNYDKH